MTLFRREVIEARRRRLFGEVRLSQPPTFLAWTLVCSAIGLAIFCGLYFGTYQRKETVSGYLAPAEGIVQIHAAKPGRIAKIYVREGDKVREGDPLIELSGETFGADTGQVLARQVAQIEDQIHNNRLRRQAVSDTFAGELLQLKNQLAVASTDRSLMSGRLDLQKQAVALIESEDSRFERLLDLGYASASKVEERQRLLLQEKEAQLGIERDMRLLDGKIDDLETQIGSLPFRRADALAALDGDLSSLQQKQVELSADRRSIERAPVSGMIANVDATLGETPRPGEPLISLMPDGSKLEAELLIPSRAAGFVASGDEARLQIAAYPFQRFGFVMGHVLSISHEVIRPGDFLAPIEFKEAVYRARVELDRDYVVTYGKRSSLRSGLVLTADIVTARLPLWRQLFDPLLAASKRSSVTVGD